MPNSRCDERDEEDNGEEETVDVNTPLISSQNPARQTAIVAFTGWLKRVGVRTVGKQRIARIVLCTLYLAIGVLLIATVSIADGLAQRVRERWSRSCDTSPGLNGGTSSDVWCRFNDINNRSGSVSLEAVAKLPYSVEDCGALMNLYRAETGPPFSCVRLMNAEGATASALTVADAVRGIVPSTQVGIAALCLPVLLILYLNVVRHCRADRASSSHASPAGDRRNNRTRQSDEYVARSLLCLAGCFDRMDLWKAHILNLCIVSMGVLIVLVGWILSYVGTLYESGPAPAVLNRGCSDYETECWVTPHAGLTGYAKVLYCPSATRGCDFRRGYPIFRGVGLTDEGRDAWIDPEHALPAVRVSVCFYFGTLALVVGIAAASALLVTCRYRATIENMVAEDRAINAVEMETEMKTST